MEKAAGRARRRQLFAAVSVLGVSLGMAGVAHAAKDDVTTTQSSHKGQASLKIQSGQSSIKYGGQSSVKGEGQSSIKYGGQSSYKEQSSMKMQHSEKDLPPPGGQSSIKGEAP